MINRLFSRGLKLSFPSARGVQLWERRTIIKCNNDAREGHTHALSTDCTTLPPWRGSVTLKNLGGKSPFRSVVLSLAKLSDRGSSRLRMEKQNRVDNALKLNYSTQLTASSPPYLAGLSTECREFGYLADRCVHPGCPPLHCLPAAFAAKASHSHRITRETKSVPSFLHPRTCKRLLRDLTFELDVIVW